MKEGRPYPERLNPCRDCAFSANSPERKPGSHPVRCGADPWEDGTAEATLLQFIETRLRADMTVHPDGWMEDPFFCHEGLPTVERAGFRYVDKVPPGSKFVLCAGFAALRDQIAAEVTGDD